MRRLLLRRIAPLAIVSVSAPFTAPTPITYCENEFHNFRPCHLLTSKVLPNEKNNISNIKITTNSQYGRRVIASREIKKGEYLFAERPSFSGTLELTHAPLVFDIPFDKQNDNEKLISDILAAIILEHEANSKRYFTESKGYKEFQYFHRDIDYRSSYEEKHIQAAQFFHRHLRCPYQKLFPTPEDLLDLLDVIYSNIHYIVPSQSLGLFPIICLFEHSCSPNIFLFSSLPSSILSSPSPLVTSPPISSHPVSSPLSSSPLPSSPLSPLSLHAIATRDIPEGETLSITYLPHEQLYYPTFMRRRFLQRQFSFDCGCPRCLSLPERVRSFQCPRCRRFSLCPSSPSLSRSFSPSDNLSCLECAFVAGEEEKRKCLEEEGKLYMTLGRERREERGERGDEREMLMERVEKENFGRLSPIHFMLIKAISQDTAILSQRGRGEGRKEGIGERGGGEEERTREKAEKRRGERVDNGIKDARDSKSLGNDFYKYYMNISTWEKGMKDLFGDHPCLQSIYDLRWLASRSAEDAEKAKNFRFHWRKE